MKVLVTGAAGKIGRRAAARLAKEGWDVRGTDLIFLKNFPGEFVVADLLRPEASHALLEGCDAVLHLGNHPNSLRGTPQRVYAENCAMNVNVFEAARERGVGRVVFASSIQAVATGVDAEGRLKPPPYLPLDSRLPFSCSNTYAASKAAGEILLAGMAASGIGIAIAVRLPWVMVRPASQDRPGLAKPPWKGAVWADAAWLHVEDAAEAFHALLVCRGEGFHTVMPARTFDAGGATAEDWRRGLCPEVPLKPGWEAPLGAFVDTSDLEALCGWKPSRTFHDEFPRD